MFSNFKKFISELHFKHSATSEKPLFPLDEQAKMNNGDDSLKKLDVIVVAAFVVYSIICHFGVGGVVVDQKIDAGYQILLRDSGEGWIETNAILYYANAYSPLAFILLVCFLLFRVAQNKG